MLSRRHLRSVGRLSSLAESSAIVARHRLGSKLYPNGARYGVGAWERGGSIACRRCHRLDWAVRHANRQMPALGRVERLRPHLGESAEHLGEVVIGAPRSLANTNHEPAGCARRTLRSGAQLGTAQRMR